jgi:flavin reductase (DIM6/NTAB) family NADH-FMN oxidoreductase RutF
LTVDPSAFRHALGRFASGVCVITTRTPAGQALGVTISSFCSVSLDPPLVLFCLGKNTNNFAAYARHTDFVVNVLAENQIELSENFASKSEDKFDGVAFEEGTGGCPILPGCTAALECRVVETHDAGDHVIVIGQVARLRTTEHDAPLLRYRGAYAKLARSG